jgi:hypothetical protein
MSCFTDLITICYYYYYYNLLLVFIIIYHLLFIIILIIIIIIVIVVWDLYTAVFYYRSLFQTAPGFVFTRDVFHRGPNGAGKSNLMDAISFVLGVRTRHLRSDRLQEPNWLPWIDVKSWGSAAFRSFREDLEVTTMISYDFEKSPLRTGSDCETPQVGSNIRSRAHQPCNIFFCDEIWTLERLF